MSNDLLVVGLGNPGPQYAGTRHNIGFICIEALARKLGITGKGETRFNAIMGQARQTDRKLFLAQPLTYMNLSGQALQKIQQFYKIPTQNVLILYDDIDLPFGKIRFRPNGSAGTHNGMKSVIQVSGTQTIARLRIGVGSPPPQWELKDYVLANFTPEEQAHLDKLATVCAEAALYWAEYGTEKAMNRYNSQTIVPPLTTEAS